MADNIAKAFATMKLVYWKPIPDGSGMRYEEPVEFKGFYIGNAQLGDGGISDMVHSGGGMRENMVLFYLTKPEVDGFVCWEKTLAELTAEGLSALPPDDLEFTHRINKVDTYVMPGSKTATLANTAFIASVV